MNRTECAYPVVWQMNTSELKIHSLTMEGSFDNDRSDNGY